MSRGSHLRPAMKGQTRVQHTPSHVQLIQHGVCVSALRTTPGASQSISDILAVLIHILRPETVALLGFAAGGILPPLSFLKNGTVLDAVDLDLESFELFQKTSPQWTSQVRFHHAEASSWLQRKRRAWPMIIDDLSIPIRDDVFKPEVSWTTLPSLIRRKLASDGIAVFNMLPNPGEDAPEALSPIADLFRSHYLIELRDYENLILVAGESLPRLPHFTEKLIRHLKSMKSIFSTQLSVRQLE